MVKGMVQHFRLRGNASGAMYQSMVSESGNAEVDPFTAPANYGDKY